MKVLISFVKWLMSVLFKIKIEDADKLPQEGGCILCLNHISLFDPIIAFCYLPRNVRFIAKQELMKIPVVAQVLKAMGVIPVKRGTGDIGAVKAALRTIKDGEILGIFPTGTREKKNPNAPVKPGVALMALKSDAPVIPVHIKASYRIFSEVVFTVGDPVELSEYAGRKVSQEELQEAAEKIYISIKSLG